MLTDAEIREFGTLGHLCVPEVLDARGIEEMERRLWRQLEGRGAERDDRSTWSADKTFGFQGIRDGDPDPVASPKLVAALDDLMGVGTWKTAQHWGQALVTFPTDEPWNVPGGSWHLDHHRHDPTDRVGDFTSPTTIDDVEIRVAEVTGRAGDVVLCHPWALHNGMPNTADRPRLMRACRVYQRALSPQVGD